MCTPLSEGNKFYGLILTASGRCDMGEHHSITEQKYCDTFAQAFKVTREFWTANKGKQINVSLSISPSATDHLSARA